MSYLAETKTHISSVDLSWKSYTNTDEVIKGSMNNRKIDTEVFDKEKKG